VERFDSAFWSSTGPDTTSISGPGHFVFPSTDKQWHPHFSTMTHEDAAMRQPYVNVHWSKQVSASGLQDTLLEKNGTQSSKCLKVKAYEWFLSQHF
jgi:hypothetical protein